MEGLVEMPSRGDTVITWGYSHMGMAGAKFLIDPGLYDPGRPAPPDDYVLG